MIELKNVSYTYPSGFRGLENFSIEIDWGEKIFIAGKTGSGKSTLLRILNGLIPNLYGGRLKGEIRGKEYLNPKHVYFVSQHVEEQFLTSNVYEEMRIKLSYLSKNKAAKRIEQALEICNASHLKFRKTSELSDGEKALVLLASAIASDAKILVFDEPFAHLHPERVRKIIDILIKEDRTVVLSEHRLNLGKEFDRVVWVGEKIASRDKGLKFDEVSDDTIIEIEDVSFGYDGTLFESLNFEIPEGIFVIYGDNGSGKTTVLKLIAGMLRYSGKINVKGKCSICLSYPFYHFSENKVLKEVEEEFLTDFGLTEMAHRHPHSLSGGQAKRVAIAKAFSSDIVLLDEPTAGQDEEFRHNLLKMILKKRKNVIIATHDENLIKAIPKRRRLDLDYKTTQTGF